MNEAKIIGGRIVEALPQGGTTMDDVLEAFSFALAFYISSSAPSADIANAAVYYVADKTLSFLENAEAAGITNWTKPAEEALS